MQRNYGIREFLPYLGQNIPFQLRHELDIRVGAVLGRPRPKKNVIVRKRFEMNYFGVCEYSRPFKHEIVRMKRRVVKTSKIVVKKRWKVKKRNELRTVTTVKMRWNANNVACNVLTKSGVGDDSRPIPRNAESKELAKSGAGYDYRPVPWLRLIRLHAELVASNTANVVRRLYGVRGYVVVHLLSCPALETLEKVCLSLRLVIYTHF
jgi:hypothetical protein